MKRIDKRPWPAEPRSYQSSLRARLQAPVFPALWGIFQRGLPSNRISVTHFLLIRELTVPTMFSPAQQSQRRGYGRSRERGLQRAQTVPQVLPMSLTSSLRVINHTRVIIPWLLIRSGRHPLPPQPRSLWLKHRAPRTQWLPPLDCFPRIPS